VNKGWFVEQLKDHLRASVAVARREGTAAAIEARDGASPSEKTVDARVALEYANLARAQIRRADQQTEDLAALEKFRPQPLAARAPISVGAVVEVDDGTEGRTLFLAPVGAGVELTMPDGDGFLTVVTPASPLGRAVIGRKVGDTVEVSAAKGEPREWTVTYVG
jgi:transcription elongation GreA/GreB family factor